MCNIGKRLEELIKHLNMTKKDFAKSINYSPGNITDWTKGRYKPSGEALMNMEQIYGVSQIWLLKGEGEMFKKDKTNTDFSKIPGLGELTYDEIALIKMYRQLTVKQQGRIEGRIEGYLEDNAKRGGSSTYQSGEEAVTREKNLA
jgi:transcriptional regulator with XRE-family HTH domain